MPETTTLYHLEVDGREQVSTFRVDLAPDGAGIEAEFVAMPSDFSTLMKLIADLAWAQLPFIWMLNTKRFGVRVRITVTPLEEK